MPRPSPITASQRQEVEKLLQEGMQRSAIAGLTGVSLRYISVIKENLTDSKRISGFPAEESEDLESLDMPIGISLSQDQYFDDWKQKWERAYKSAIAQKKLPVVVTLLNQYANKLVKEPQIDPIVELQPIEYCPILPPISINDIGIQLVAGVREMIVGTLLAQDDVNQLYSAILKYYPDSQEHD